LENRGKSNEKSDPGDLGLPQMQIGGIPDSTKLFEISMYDHKFGFDHGEMRIVYDKSGAIARRRVAEITGPAHRLKNKAVMKSPSRPWMEMMVLSALEEGKDTIQSKSGRLR
jgi:hypothetical protein